MRTYTKVKYGDIRKAIKSRVSDPIVGISKDVDIMRQIANKAIEIVNPYVPMKKGYLRKSAHVIYHEKQVQIVWGDSTVVDKRGVKTSDYARYQHDMGNATWNYTTPGTKAHWTEELLRGTPGFERLVKYTTPLVRVEVKKRASK